MSFVSRQKCLLYFFNFFFALFAPWRSKVFDLPLLDHFRTFKFVKSLTCAMTWINNNFSLVTKPWQSKVKGVVPPDIQRFLKNSFHFKINLQCWKSCQLFFFGTYKMKGNFNITLFCIYTHIYSHLSESVLPFLNAFNYHWNV